jgi:hypothetical protein
MEIQTENQRRGLGSHLWIEIEAENILCLQQDRTHLWIPSNMLLF